MTSTQFNIRYKDYLEVGHYGLDIEIPSVIDFLDGVFTDLIKIPGFKYSQIKLKFNDARFYTNLEGKLDSLIENRIMILVNLHNGKRTN